MSSVLPTTGSSNQTRPGRFTIIFASLVWVLAVGLRAGALVYLPPVRVYSQPAEVDVSLRLSDLVGFLFVLVMVTFGVLIVQRSASRRYGWLMLVTGFWVALIEFTTNYSQYALLVAPAADLPLGLAAAWVHDLWMISFMLVACLPFLFPNGNLPSPRWRWVFWPTIIAWSLLALTYTFAKRPLGYETFMALGENVPNPLGIIPFLEDLTNALFAVLIPIAILGGLTSLIVRWRGAAGDVRQQIKWVFYFLIMWLATLTAIYIDDIVLREMVGIDLGLARYLAIVMDLMLIGAGVALGFAVLKYRLYDIDLIINRTLIYGGLTVAIVVGYVLLVSGLGVLLPDEVGLVPSLIATAVLAVLFAPLKDRLQRGANRLVFGERREPYEVMRTLGAHLETATVLEQVLPAIAETIARSLKFPYVSVTLNRAGDFSQAAEYGSRRRDVINFPLYHQAGMIGYLSVCPRDGEPEPARQDRELLRQIALWLGPVTQAWLLTRELRQSHARLVAAQAEERRRLYRDLHDGLGPTLASQTFRFDHALDMLPENPQAAMQILSDLKAQTQGLILEIRRLVYALRSSTLDELGLVGSLREAIEGFRGAVNGMQIILEGDEQALRQLPAAHEQAAERIALEALTNVVRHARADCCRLTLEIQAGSPSLLQMIIEDNGQGLQPMYSPGVGIASMIERAEALGGTIKIELNQPQGTRIVARLPFAKTRDSMEGN